MLRHPLSHPVTCILIGVAVGYVLANRISAVPVVNKLPQV